MNERETECCLLFRRRRRRPSGQQCNRSKRIEKTDKFGFSAGEEKIANNKAPPPSTVQFLQSSVITREAKKIGHEEGGGSVLQDLAKNQCRVLDPFSYIVVSHAHSQTRTNSHITHTNTHTHLLTRTYAHTLAHTQGRRFCDFINFGQRQGRSS